MRDNYVKPSAVKLPRATYHILCLGVCLVITGVIMAIFGYYAPLLRLPKLTLPKTNSENPKFHLANSNASTEEVTNEQLIVGYNPNAAARKSPKSHFSSLKDKYAAAVEMSAGGRGTSSTWLDWYELRLTIFSYAGPCFMGLGCIILVIVYVVAFEARDRARHSSVVVLKDASIQSSQRLTERGHRFWRDSGSANRFGRHFAHPYPANGRLSANLSDPELYSRQQKDYNGIGHFGMTDFSTGHIPTIIIRDSSSGIISDIPSCSNGSPRDTRYTAIPSLDKFGDDTNSLCLIQPQDITADSRLSFGSTNCF